ncbi:choline BCCT transporter BetT [Oligella ureolytica]
MPIAAITSLLALFMIIIFFVTSADSGALVLDILSSKEKMPSPVWQRIFWSTMTGIVAIALLLADGLQALQTATIAKCIAFLYHFIDSSFWLVQGLKN